MELSDEINVYTSLPGTSICITFGSHEDWDASHFCLNDVAHASVELPPAASATATLLHLDKPRASASLGDGSSCDKIDRWVLDTGTTHHMTGRREFFTELDSSVRGSVKFGDTSDVEIKGVGSIIFTSESGEHRMLTESTTSPR